MWGSRMLPHGQNFKILNFKIANRTIQNRKKKRIKKKILLRYYVVLSSILKLVLSLI